MALEKFLPRSKSNFQGVGFTVLGVGVTSFLQTGAMGFEVRTRVQVWLRALGLGLGFRMQPWTQS